MDSLYFNNSNSNSKDNSLFHRCSLVTPHHSNNNSRDSLHIRRCSSQEGIPRNSSQEGIHHRNSSQEDIPHRSSKEDILLLLRSSSNTTPSFHRPSSQDNHLLR